MKSCGPCSLKTGCYLVSLYTFLIGIVLLGFNGYEWHYYTNGVARWDNVTSVVFAVILFFAAVCLFLGLRKNSNALMGAWTVIFFIYCIVQIAYIIFMIVQYSQGHWGNNYHQTALSNIIVFALMILVNIWCILAVRSYRGGGVNINI